MDFDPISFALGTAVGAGIGSGITYALLKSQADGDGADQSGESAFKPGKTPARVLYQNDLTNYLEAYHLMGDQIRLSELLVEPRLMVQEYDVLSDDDDPFAQGPGRVIPRIHDFPEIYAAYNMEYLPLEDLGVCHPHMSILGITGAGKSTALATIALIALGKIDYNTMRELMDQAIEEEYAGLAPEEQERRKKEFEQVRQRAAEKLREVQRRKEAAGAAVERDDLRDLLPIFIHAGDIELDLNRYGMEIDSAEPLVSACRSYLPRATWDMIAYIMYQELDLGRALVLIDGFDELPRSERTRIYPWLEQFIEDYGNNRIIIAGPATGYDGLTRLGFIPAFLKPWTPMDTENAIQNWQRTYESMLAGNKKKRKKDDQPLIDPQIANQLRIDVRHRLPIEITLKTWATLNGDIRELGRRGWFEAFVRKHSPDLEQTSAILREIAMVMLDRNTLLKREQIAEIATTHLTDAEEKPITNIDEFVKSLCDSQLMVGHADDVYDFCHPMIKAYLAGERLIVDMPQRLTEVATAPAWLHAIGFASAALDLTPAVVKRMQDGSDLLFNNLFGVARWIPDTPRNTKWVSEILKKFAGAFLAPSQFPAIRERAMAALIASRDENALFVIRQGVRNGDPVIRRLACVGLGALAEEDVIQDLRPMLVDDDMEVQLAAAQALGAIGTEDALKVMIQGLLEGEDVLRQAVAEAMATIPGEGHNILHDAIEFDDVKVRRAAVFGLARIPAGWALVDLYRVMLEDAEWYVRAAAEVAFTQARDPDRMGLHPFPPLNQLNWLSELASSMGESVPEGDKAIQLVVRILQQGNPQQRMLAAQTLGKLADPGTIKPLYAALTDQEESVRMAAYHALADVQARVKAHLPGLI